MSLKNLLGISLEAVETDREQIGKLLEAARRNIRDAQLEELSAENRFDASYKAIMQVAMVALLANGYRTLTSKPGHHQTAIQTLPLTIGVPKEDVIVLDALRKQRNLADYSGDLISDEAVQECLASAQVLMSHVTKWLGKHRPELT
ncbi:DNA-binding protein [Ramlibacter albus]|uniref:DNA-binding protein n=1 Tax=Ramlibacter albus TaxID=2079448 RepID=A0A923MBK5_9BURK|nr:DNA-binding protein [Ramlibacter albus]MBC5767373.1 DNA-binding protein [Ramlibacter albus]